MHGDWRIGRVYGDGNCFFYNVLMLRRAVAGDQLVMNCFGRDRPSSLFGTAPSVMSSAKQLRIVLVDIVCQRSFGCSLATLLRPRRGRRRDLVDRFYFDKYRLEHGYDEEHNVDSFVGMLKDLGESSAYVPHYFAQAVADVDNVRVRVFLRGGGDHETFTPNGSDGSGLRTRVLVQTGYSGRGHYSCALRLDALNDTTPPRSTPRSVTAIRVSDAPVGSRTVSMAKLPVSA